MESFTITVTGKPSELKSVFFTPIDLDVNYEIGVVDFGVVGIMGRRLTFKTKSDDEVVTDMVDMSIGDNNIY